MKRLIIFGWGIIFASCLVEAENSGYDVGKDPMRYIENDRLKIGINLGAGGAVTFLEDKACESGNMINSYDWGRQIQQSYYSGPIPFVGPNGEEPVERWTHLGWNPIQAGSAGGLVQKSAVSRCNEAAACGFSAHRWNRAGAPHCPEIAF